MVYNKCSTSYGLIVKSAFNSIVVLRRKVPYCVQDFFLHLSRKKGLTLAPMSFSAIKQQFELEWGPRLRPCELEDYQRFLNGEVFEDEFDFPHGQLKRSKKYAENKYVQFCSAYREFQEESGFHFSFTERDVERYPLVWIEFEGLDGFQYKQYYFIVDNVKDLRRHTYFNSFKRSSTVKNQIQSWNDDRLIYHGQLMPLEKAYEKFLQQQHLKRDMKHLLCLNCIISRPLDEEETSEMETMH
ncbi:hypothetical protein AVEN_97257-1 [Araneus ventricosus]|uniref:Uncharacterized protein n=1 Tax=Araneus ventricosus TaxID=182803 RepID=A0A4Y1ZNR4_ARAVE|nr:hypothetical protein AVEN_97257-1 [Araneus ventricosus]